MRYTTSTFFLPWWINTLSEELKKLAAAQRAWRSRSHVSVAASRIQAKKWRLANRDKLRKNDRRWKKANLAQRVAYKRDRRRSNVLFRLTLNLRGRLHSALIGKTKSKATLELLGCSISDLQKHLESGFMQGMTWENYGVQGWHVDHIKPCAAFDLADPEQPKQCFHYTNLQPLWAKDNLKKGCTFP